MCLGHSWCRWLRSEFCCPTPGPGGSFQLANAVVGRIAFGMFNGSVNGSRISGLVGKTSRYSLLVSAVETAANAPSAESQPLSDRYGTPKPRSPVSPAPTTPAAPTRRTERRDRPPSRPDFSVLSVLSVSGLSPSVGDCFASTLPTRASLLAVMSTVCLVSAPMPTPPRTPQGCLLNEEADITRGDQC